MSPTVHRHGHSTRPNTETSPRAIRARLGHLLGDNDIVFLSSAARAAQGVEQRYKDAFRRAIFEAAHRALDDLASGRILSPDDFDFQPLVTEQAIAAMRAGTKRPAPITTKLSKDAALQKIFKQWDRWRKGQLPRRQRKDARSIKDVFLHTVRDFWRQHSESFRRGDVYDQEAVKAAFAKRAKIVVSRADMIVNTETTNYFNQARTEIYNASPAVTHYLFVSIRDRRTTVWCKTREGLVYKKGEQVTDAETPACHWNCRSEMLPLTLSNPRHLRLIKNTALWRENNHPHPLPRGWKTG